MSSPRRVGLMILMWIARHLLNGGLTEEERAELRQLATSLHVMQQEAPRG
jgi:hypothetical protein